MILGDRYKADRVFPAADSKNHGMPDEVLDAMKETVDALSIEYYRHGDWFEQDLERMVSTYRQTEHFAIAVQIHESKR